MNKSYFFTLYASFIFLLSCVVVIPLLIILGQKRQWHHTALTLHEYWAHVYFRLIFIKVVIEGKENLSLDEQYIFCANHFSYLDIPAFYLLFSTKFIGKSSLTKIPLFGYFFRKIHIPVNRSSARSRAESIRKSREALDDGFNVTFFPEGGVVVTEEDLPYMAPFKDGAFRLAVQKQVPIVPVIMPYNFILLPDRSPVRFHRHVCKVIAKPPVYPQADTEEEVKRLKKEVFEIIQSELLAHHPDKVRPVG